MSDENASTVIAANGAVQSLPRTAPLRVFMEKIGEKGNEAQLQTFAEQQKPQTTALGGATTAVVSTGGQVASVFSDRLSALRSGVNFAATEAQSGFATGDGGLNKAFWLKPFGSWGKQSKSTATRKNVKEKFDGYSMTTKGLAVGVDGAVTDKVRVGTAVSYSTSKIKGKGVGKDKTDVKSWQVSLYGDYSTDRYYLEGSIGYGRNDVSTSSKVAFLTKKADYDTTSVTASVGGGVPMNLTSITTITPTAGLSWTRVGSAKYTEKGASVLNNKVALGTTKAVIGTLGTQIQTRLTRGTGVLIPTARVGLSYDFAAKPSSVKYKLVDDDKFTKVTGPEAKKLSGTAGLGLTYSAPRWSIGADYDLNARTGYKGHTARVNAMVKF